MRRLINRIIMYSAIKIRAKAPALYSVLNPDTSSDSPSAKSNGVRLDSARIEINHIGARGRARSNFGDRDEAERRDKSNVIRRRRGERIISVILTS